MNKKLEAKLKTLPNSSGVYLHKAENGDVIYVGKAAVLKNRVRQYFQSSKDFDNKTRALVSDIYDTDWIETDSEIDALFLESELVKRYMPKYNVLLRDDKSQIYIRINMREEKPYISYTRHPLDDGADYYGPYFNGLVLKKAMRQLRRVFPYYVKSQKSNTKLDLDVHMKLSPDDSISSSDYKKNLRRLIGYIKGEKKSIIKQLENEMKDAATSHDFERASILRDQIFNLKELRRKIMFGDKEFLNISKDQALADLAKLLNLKHPPKRIEGFDISHMSGSDVVASMVVFVNGVSNRAEYRKFKTRFERNDDFANMNETISRRFSQKNIKSWGMPDLLLIDGGKGQLDAAIKAIQDLEMKIPIIGLAKREEQIVVSLDNSNVSIDQIFLSSIKGYSTFSEKFALINIDNNSHIIKLLQRIRDESHRFAVSYHSNLKTARQTASALTEIPGIGQSTQKKLLKKFGSVAGIKSATAEDILDVVGKSKSEIIKKYL
jgi:excinuclease ABC subunit C